FVRLFFVVLVLRLARREIVEIRQRHLRRVVLERVRAAVGLHRNGAARALIVLLLRFGVATALWFRVRSEVAASRASRRNDRGGIERPGREAAWTRAGESAGARAGRASGTRRAAGSTVFTRP